MTETLADVDTAAAVLDFARGQRSVADAAEANLLQAAVAWAGMHSTDSLADAAMAYDPGFGQTEVPV
ncbi:hypothetical protein, partial [Nocardioides sp.]|uniref:hypothetical protein n=1 Tax=Nocardioides sp. TaxID=35761 RepID=UPI003567BA4D